ncbi:MAG: diguanylate cyclase [Desulfurivibrionaceae bacterium]|nr:diguanylate cyclase [Desulfurivibrionaceae bacterium]
MAFSENNLLLQTPAFLLAALNNIADPVLILDCGFTILFANKAAGQFFGAAPCQGEKACSCHQMIFNLDRPCEEHGEQCPLKLVVESQKEVEVIREVAFANGQTKWLQIKALPLFDETGQVVSVVQTIHDISCTKEMASALDRYSRSQDDFFIASRKITTTDRKELYRHIVRHAKDLLQFDFSTLLLFSEDKRSLVVQDTMGFPESMINSVPFVEGQGLASHVTKTKSPQVVKDFLTESRFEIPPFVLARDIRSALGVPMVVTGEVLGVLVGHTLKPRTFTDQEIILYDSLANQAAMALHSANTFQKLRASEDRYHDLFKNSQDIIQMVGPDGKILYVNKAWEKALGYSAAEIPHLSAFDIIHPDCRPHCQEVFGQLCQGGKVDLLETTFLTKNGRSFCVEGHINGHIKNGKLVSTRGIFRDVTDRKHFEEKLKKLSITDELTQLLNRRGFFALAEKQLAITARSGGNLYLLYLDIDNMKWINDHKGHKVGDQALTDTARLLRETFRDGDIMARIGGDEFTVLLTAIADNRNAREVVARFEQQLALLNEEENRGYVLLISTGLVKYQGKTPCLLEELMGKADDLMYENKRQRKKSRQAHP